MSGSARLTFVDLFSLICFFLLPKNRTFAEFFAVFGAKVTVKSANCDLFGDFERLASDKLAGVFP